MRVYAVQVDGVSAPIFFKTRPDADECVADYRDADPSATFTRWEQEMTEAEFNALPEFQGY